MEISEYLRIIWRRLWILLLVPLLAGGVVAAQVLREPTKYDAIELPKPSELQALTFYPDKIHLKGGDDAQQLILTATLKNGRLQDLTDPFSLRKSLRARPHRSSRAKTMSVV